jgi:hypothetical protein
VVGSEEVAGKKEEKRITFILVIVVCLLSA